MFNKISNLVKSKFTTKLGERARDQEVLKQILFCTAYDNFKFPFHVEENGNGDKISIYDRSPLVDVGLGLIRNTIDTVTSFVFGEGRFPDLETKNTLLRTTMLDMMNESRMFNVMQDAMLWGSLGSVAIQVVISSTNRVFFKVWPTQFLTPTWDKDEPDKLLSIKELYIVSGADLKAQGYDIDEKNEREDFFFQRIFDDTSETWFIPWPVTLDPTKDVPVVDKKRSYDHKLGVMPWVWIKNLKGGDDLDGSCTFRNAIKTCIEIDYLVSQADRGLKYNADPLIAVSGANDQDGDFFKGPATGLNLDTDGRAEILEIKGSSYNIVIEQVKQLREAALEAMGGHRGSPERMHSVQSGAALEQLWLPTLLLASDLRNAYGENGLLKLLKIVLQIGSTRSLRINEKLIPLLPKDDTFVLRWGPFFEPTVADQQMQVNTMVALINGRLMSQKSAIMFLSNEFGIEDVEAEIRQIQAEEALADAREIKLQAQLQVKANQN